MNRKLGIILLLIGFSCGSANVPGSLNSCWALQTKDDKKDKDKKNDSEKKKNDNYEVKKSGDPHVPYQPPKDDKKKDDKKKPDPK